MRRRSLKPRANWQSTVEQQGLTFHTLENGDPYWDESAAYQLSAAEVDTLETAANKLQGMCLAAAQHVIDQRRYEELGIAPEAVPMIEWAWNAEPPALYGRFDVSWGGAGTGAAPKLLEYNADTPTSLLEASVIQWYWLEDLGPALGAKPDQFNSMHERLIAKWKDIAPFLKQPLYFAGTDEPEDILTVVYLRDTAQQAGLQTEHLAMLDIGWNAERNAFVDLAERPIESIFKLYPWESMMKEAFAEHALATYQNVRWIEPIWKMLLSNKGILPILWELYPNDPNLLPSYFDDDPGAATPHGLSSYVRKPLHSREGANIAIVRDGRTLETSDGPYAGRGIVQALAPEAGFAADSGEMRYPVLGLWMVDQECAGMGIRESKGRITGNLSSFVPHYFL
jgi:glutathionylspermidine synthase